MHLVGVWCLSSSWGTEAGSIAKKPTLSWGMAQAVLCFDAFGTYGRNQEQNISVCHIEV